MTLSLKHERDNLYRLDITGVMQERDFRAAERDLAAQMGEGRRIRLLVVLDGFEGWEPGASWRNLSFYMKHGHDIERIAFVGDDRWRDEALMFAAADLRDAPVASFGAVQAAQAHAWLSH